MFDRIYIPPMAPKDKPERTIIASNNKARFEYEILDTFEAGLALLGSEVKALRNGKVNIAEAHGEETNGEIWLYNMNIPAYKQAGVDNHEPKRPRKLLLHKKEISKIMGRINEKGLTLITLNLYFNKKGLAKLEIGIGKGKKLHDKRETIKQREWDRSKARILKGD